MYPYFPDMPLLILNIKKIRGKRNIKCILNSTAVVSILWLSILKTVNHGALKKCNINT